MDFVDTHCHIHFPDYPLDTTLVIKNAIDLGVTKMICVGCTLDDSQAGVALAVQNPKYLWASIGIHPHESKLYDDAPEKLDAFRELAASKKVVAIGECGLDYYYSHSPRESQVTILRFQIELAIEHELPMIFHVRDAFDDFWSIYDSYKQPIRGVIHSFSATEEDVKEILRRDLYFGLNGIMTFSKRPEQLAAAKAIPIDKLLLETDSPFLTPVPHRGTVNEPKYVRVTAEFLSNLRNESLNMIAAKTTQNAHDLFGLV